MSKRPLVRCLFAASVAVVGALTASAAPILTPIVSGTAPSGIPWSAVATGTALPIRTSATSPNNGAPGAVVYFDPVSGQLQFDPNGLKVSTFILTYTSGTANVSGTTPGPFQYLTGTGANAWSPSTGAPRTFPAVTAVSGLDPTTQPARVAAQVGPPLSTNLTASGDVGNIASTGTWWNQAWAFPSDLVISGSISSIIQGDFKTIGQQANANANILGYGSQRSVFQYTVNGITGNQVGAVIPATLVPEPSSVVMIAASVASAFVIRRRREKS